jgi:hypothetical protein
MCGSAGIVDTLGPSDIQRSLLEGQGRLMLKKTVKPLFDAFLKNVMPSCHGPNVKGDS